MAHIHEKIDFTVEVFIVYKDTVLLRLHDKYNKWLSVGGHIELDEDPNQAAIREVKEEVGLDIKLWEGMKYCDYETSTYKELIPPNFLNIHSFENGHKHICLTYFASSNSNVVIPEYEGDKSKDWKWVNVEQLEKMSDLDEPIKFYALKALNCLKK